MGTCARKRDQETRRVVICDNFVDLVAPTFSEKCCCEGPAVASIEADG